MQYTYRHTLHACYLGFITQAIVNNLAPLLFIIFQTEYNLSFEMIGRLILINFGTQIIVDYLAARFIDKIGHRKAVVTAHGFSTLGLFSLGVLPKLLPTPYLGLVTSVIIYAIGGGIIEVLISPIVESLPGEAKASAMSLLHSFYCWGQLAVVLITTVLIKILGAGVWHLLPILWALLPLYNLFNFLKVPLAPPVAEADKTPLKELFSSKVFLIVLILMMCAGSSELTMSQWSSLFAEKGLQVPKMVGDLLGPCLFALLMGIGRTIYGVRGHQISLNKALTASGILCLICYGVAVFVQIPLLSLLGCALCGLSVSLMWPGTLSLAARAYPKGGTAMFGMLAICGDLGGAIGPWLAGWVSDLAQQSTKLVAFGARNGLGMDQLGLKLGLLAAMVFPLALLIGILLLRKERSYER
jgi:fucose permease